MPSHLKTSRGATRFHPCFIWLVLPTETFFPPGICAVFFRSLPGDPYHYAYFEEELGNHTWKEWDRWIEIFLQWLPRKIEFF